MGVANAEGVRWGWWVRWVRWMGDGAKTNSRVVPDVLHSRDSIADAPQYHS